MRHKPKAKAKRSSASSEASKTRVPGAAAKAGSSSKAATSSKATPVAKAGSVSKSAPLAKSGLAAKAKAKAQAVASRLKGAKTVVAAVKSKTVAKAKSAKVAKAATVAKAKPAKPEVSGKGAKPVKAPRSAVIAGPLVAAGKTLAVKTRKPKTPLSGAKQAKFALGQVVKHRIYAFRGVVFDIDPVFANTEDWWLAIPADVRPRKDQPFYHLLAENEETEYIAYVSEQNLIADTSGQPLRHPQLQELFVEDDDGRLRAVFMQPN